MRIKNFFILLLITCIVSSAAIAQDMGQDEMMKVWQEYMTPGPVQKHMAKFVGDWVTSNKMWAAPGAEPIVSEGTAKGEMLLGGRYLKTTHYGDMMGMPFEGFSLEAYDNTMKQYYSIWVDNFGTGMMMMKGTWDDATKKLTYTGTMVDPMQKKEVAVKEVFIPKDEDTYMMELYVTGPDGKEYKNMEATYKRKK